MPRQQRTVHYSGHVQGVGFRFTTQALARKYDVHGYVQNLPDGRVRIVVQGEPEELDRFLAEVEQRMAEYIWERKVDVQTPSGNYHGFQIRY